MSFNPVSSPAAAATFHRANAAMATPDNIFKVNNYAANSAEGKEVKAVNFPVQMGSSDPEDVKYKIRAKALTGPGGNPSTTGVIPGVGQVIAGEDYFNYLKRKMDVAEEVQFKDWLMKQANFDTPEAAEYWYTRFPWMLDQRLKEVDRVSRLQLDRAKINITGPQTVEDWMLLWNEERGLIKIPNVAVHELPKSTYADEKGYIRGMFSVMTKFVPPFDGATEPGNPAYKPASKFNWANPGQNPNKQYANTMFGFPTVVNSYAPGN